MRRDSPHQLYKYFAPERWSFLSDLRVRYTQLGGFNDPFEGRPEVTALSTKEDILVSLGRILPDEVERTYKSLPAHVQATISFRQVRLLAEHLMETKEGELLQAIESVTPLAASFITGKVDQLLGAMCLSEVPDSLLMWAHYAASHTGFIVEFDGWHPYFHQQLSDEDDLRHVRRVQYRESRPSAPLSTMGATELFLVKSGHWAYEREWRIVRPLADAAATIEAQPYPIALFEVPAAAIKSITLGARIEPTVESNLRQAVLRHPTLQSIAIRRAVPDSTHFLLRVVADDN